VKEFFGEKSQQIEPPVLEAFGIEIHSRYGQASELIELMNFASLAAQKKVAHYVKRAFHDSKAYLCTLELDSSVQEGDAVAAAILEAATETIGQFDWFGAPQHGGDVLKMYAGTSE
jgi:hypothetical protein